MSNKEASKAILKGIQNLIKEELKKAPVDQTLTGVVKEVKEDNLYDVYLGGILYTNVPSIFMGLEVNNTVKIKVPQGQYSQMYIEGKYNITLENTGGIVSEVNWSDIIGKPSDLVQDSNYVHTDNNYTTEEKNKLSTIQSGAEVNVQSDWNESNYSSDSYIKNKPIISNYTIEEVGVTSGYLKTYQLKKDSEYIGAKINIPKDMVVSDGSVKIVSESDVPYEGAIIGDKYIDLIISNAQSSHIYIPVQDLVDVYTSGASISISSSNVISVITDTSLSSTSVNPVQNKVIKGALDVKLDTTGNASNVTNTFTQASTRTNLNSGEKLSISLGKIMKWFIDLKTVAFSGNYNDLINKPESLPANGGNSDTVDNIHVNDNSTGNVLWTAEKILSQIENSKPIGYQYNGTVSENEVVNITIPETQDYKIPNIEVLIFINSTWQKAIHGIDYVYSISSSTNLKITFFTAGNYKVNYFIVPTGNLPNFIMSESQPVSQNKGDYWFQII